MNAQRPQPLPRASRAIKLAPRPRTAALRLRGRARSRLPQRRRSACLCGLDRASPSCNDRPPSDGLCDTESKARVKQDAEDSKRLQWDRGRCKCGLPASLRCLAEATTPAKTGRAPMSAPRQHHDAPSEWTVQGGRCARIGRASGASARAGRYPGLDLGHLHEPTT